MPSSHSHRPGRWVAGFAGALCLGFAVGSVLSLHVARLSGRIVPMPPIPIPSVTITPDEIDAGVTIPANTNVTFTLPSDFDRINREVLLGAHGRTVRYWGYCISPNAPAPPHRPGRFPGTVFLSEKERAVQAEALREHKPSAAVTIQIPARDTPDSALPPSLQHGMDVFLPGMRCSIMTEQQLPMGLDPDGDGLNNKLEADIGTDPLNPDTDGDGITDGVEYQSGTNPLVRDTDGDGLIDGMEDKNFNGRVDPGETDPRNKDSDHDGLCDGLCLVTLADGRQLWMGEDVNLNGQVDAGETDPLNRDTNGDGIDDYDEVMACIRGDTSICPDPSAGIYAAATAAPATP